MDEAAAFAYRAKEAGPPCSECRYKTLLGMCGSPAYAVQRFSPATGEYSSRSETDLDTARSDGGLCGPEALLFEPQGWFVPLVVGTWRGARAAFIAAIAGFILVLWLLG